MRKCDFLCLISLFLFTNKSIADGMVVDKVYHPYVLPNEMEFEWRVLSRQDEDQNILSQRLGYGLAISQTIALETYLIGERNGDGDFGLQAYEIEARMQLVEQGRYWADWGLLLEIEKEHQKDNFEITTGLLFEKEINKTSLTLNAFVVYEWGDTLEDEIELEFRAQYRYRWIPQVQPSIEIYTGEDFIGIGPGFMGLQRFQGQKQLKWEAGFITEVGGGGKDHSFHFALEYEF